MTIIDVQMPLLNAKKFENISFVFWFPSCSGAFLFVLSLQSLAVRLRPPPRVSADSSQYVMKISAFTIIPLGFPFTQLLKQPVVAVNKMSVVGVNKLQ